MTNNADFNTALTWCVTHFQDRDFNEPLIFLKSDKASSFDGHLIGLVEKAIRESRRGPLLHACGPSTEVQPQQSGATASCKKPPLSSTDNNESGFSFDWDDDDDLGDMLEDVNDEVPVAAGIAGPVSSKKAFPANDGITEASAPQLQPQKAAEKLDTDGWDGFDDFDDMLNDDDKVPVTLPGETNEIVHNASPSESRKSVSNMSVPAESNNTPVPKNPPLDSSPAASNNDGDGDGGGWGEGDGFENFDDMLNEKYGDEDGATQQDTEPASSATPAAMLPAEKSAAMRKETVATPPSPLTSESKAIDPVAKPLQPSPPSGLKPTNSKLVPTPPPKPNTTKSNSSSTSLSRPPPPTPPPRPPPAQPKVAAAPLQSPIRSIREQSQLLSQEERKRMAEEGRRLLREKRLAQQSNSSSSTAQRSSSSSVSRPTRPTTRSMTSSRGTAAVTPASSGAASTSTSSLPTAVIDRAGTAAKVTDPSERERLIMEGRRLLMEARKAKKSGEAASVGATPKPKLKPKPPPTPPPRRSPLPPSALSAPSLDDAGKSEKERDDDDNWDDFDKF